MDELSYKSRYLINLNHLSSLEKRIALYISHHPKEVAEMKISALSGKYFTVPNTVSRLCHKLDYSGYLEMKRAIQKENNGDVSGKSGIEETFQRNFQLVQSQNFAKLIKSFRKARRINVLALGSTEYAARIIVDNLNGVENKFRFFDYNEIKARIVKPQNDIFFFVSLSGEQRDLEELAMEAKSRNLQVITLTGLTENNLSKLSDISLFCWSPARHLNERNIQDKIPLLLVMEEVFDQYKSNRKTDKYEK